MAYGEPRCPMCGMNWPLHVLPCTPTTTRPHFVGLEEDSLIQTLLRIHWKNGATVVSSRDFDTGEETELALLDDNDNIIASMGDTWEFCNECYPQHRQNWPCNTVKLLWEHGYGLE